jgi:hypothetical protein
MATAEVSPLPMCGSESWADDFSAALRRQRDRVRDFLAAQQERLKRAEAQLSEQLEHLAAELARGQAETHQAKEEVRQQSEQLTRQIASLEDLRREFAARQAEWEQLQQRTAQQQESLLEQVCRQQDELQQRRAELQQEDAEEQAALREQLEAARRRKTELAAEVQSLRDKCDQLSQQCADASQRSTADKDKEIEDYRRRYEMALGDLRELKAHDAELQQQVAKARSAGLQPPRSAGGTLDWEAEKRRILDALEAEFDEDDPQEQAERPRIEEVIRTSEQILAEKDREIAELKQLLEDQSANLGTVAVGAAAVGEIVDKDAIIQEQRENLRRLEEQWREKLRQAEIDISIQRATIARQRAQVEEKLRLLENADAKAGAKSAEAENAGKPARGRWLARLGLKDLEQEKGGP